MIPVKKIAEENEFALIEYRDKSDIHRVAVPLKTLVEKDGKVEISETNLKKGIPYGVDWDALFPGLDNLNLEMHRRDIWVFQDALAKAKETRAAVIASTGKIIQTIFEGG